jgi:hypothetical protein
VARGRPQFEDAEVDTLLNPVLIVELLSESTEAYDRGAKFAHYRNRQPGNEVSQSPSRSARKTSCGLHDSSFQTQDPA